MVILGLGSNLESSFGDRFKNIDLAITSLNNLGVSIIKKSSYYETPSYPKSINPKFINVIVLATFNSNPKKLASLIIEIENKLERKRSVKNAPRTCDIDIIDYNGKIIDFTYKDLAFSVPHSKLIHRNFVLYPMQEILPDWKHPKTNELIGTLIEKLPREDKNSILKVNKY